MNPARRKPPSSRVKELTERTRREGRELSRRRRAEARKLGPAFPPLVLGRLAAWIAPRITGALMLVIKGALLAHYSRGVAPARRGRSNRVSARRRASRKDGGILPGLQTDS